MTGVIMHAFGPGAGPVTPSGLVPFLRRPLGDLLPSAGERSALDDVVLLDLDDLTDAAMEIACDYNHALFYGRDPAAEWLPAWAWQRAEQVERLSFQSLVQAGNHAGARLVADYGPIPPDRVYRYGRDEGAECWWPCPVCR